MDEGDDNVPVSAQRVSASYENLSSRFQLQDRNFERQYAHLYVERLKIMSPMLKDAAKKKWGKFSFNHITNHTTYIIQGFS